jgi:hypothetical protein
MQSASPTLSGFRSIVRRPSLGLAEIAWRWTFGFAASLLLLLSFEEYLKTLPVSTGDLWLLRSGQPGLISQAIQHILQGSAPRVIAAAIVLGSALATAWVGLAALGRAVTLRAVESYFPDEGAAPPGNSRWGLGSLAGLNLLRVAITVAAGFGWLAAWLVASAAASGSDPSPGLAVLMFLAAILLVWLAWSVMNWLLSFATVFVVAGGEDTFGAIASALHCLGARVGAVLAASTWFGLAHLAAFGLASSAVVFPLVFAGVLPRGVVFGGVLMVALLYFAVADFLYMGRLAAYVAIVENPDRPSLQELVPRSEDGRPPRASPGLERGVDPEELILSDVPQ